MMTKLNFWVEYPFNSDSFQYDPVSRGFQIICFFARRPNGIEVYIFDLFKVDSFGPTLYVVYIGAFIRSNGSFHVLDWVGTNECWSRICPKGMSQAGGFIRDVICLPSVHRSGSDSTCQKQVNICPGRLKAKGLNY